MKNKRVSFLVSFLLTILILLAFVVLIEGGIRISTTKLSDIDRLVSNIDGIELPAVAVDSSKKDVVVAVYRSSTDKNKVFVAEYSKNALWDLYSLDGVHDLSITELPFHSVISSPLKDYAYRVDPESMRISIYDGESNGNVYTYGIGIALLVIGFAVKNRLKEKKS